MLLLDVLVRYSAVALLLLLTVLAIRDGKKSAPTNYAALVAVSVAAMLLSTAPTELQLPRIPFVIAHIIDIPNIAFIWWLGLSMFQDDFKLRPWHWGLCILYTALVLIYRFLEFDVIAGVPAGFDLLVDVVTFAMLAHLAFVTIKGRSDDVNNARRKFRLYFILALVVGSALTVQAENMFMDNFAYSVSLFRALVALPLTVWALLWLTKLQPEILAFQPIVPTLAKPSGLDPRDQALHKRLLEEMETNKIYLEPNLSIRALAEKIKTPEHRLRVLINKGLGFQNFSAFLNQYRIEAVKAAFADPDNVRIPVLTIALDAGYNSLAPFNRAFLKAVGMTPSVYRQELLKK